MPNPFTKRSHSEAWQLHVLAAFFPFSRIRGLGQWQERLAAYPFPPLDRGTLLAF